MIKVAHIMQSYLGQTETFIWQYLRQFQQVSPVIIAGSLQNLDQFPLPEGRFYEVYGSRLTRLWFINAWYGNVLRNPWGYVERIMKREHIQVMHAHFGPMACEYLPVSLSLGIPLIATFYGYDLSRVDTLERYRERYAALFSREVHFLVEGPHMLHKLSAIGCPKTKISIQRIAIDLDNYRYRTKAWDGKRPIRLLFVGRFVEKKGLEFALRALASLRKDHHFELKVIGDGDLQDHLHALADSLGFTNEIIWMGVKPHQKVIEELEACDLLIQPSVTAADGESEGGAPTVLLEAQALGVPIISTFHADIPYVTSPGGSALLSPERDVEALAKNIRDLLENPDRWSRMGQTGRAHVEKYHDIKKEVITLEKVYTDVLQGCPC